ncbi:uncharacterized protein LOC123670565 [Harmonia axyridis]|uniref:uncharacterized protein LOC123670565 n=1 Tax=Harmonia axyridis TaxID=115357 RepID=UPI001E279546|nr:uncharacterized protein LOC123670565 [Harmonia axyridis]
MYSTKSIYLILVLVTLGVTGEQSKCAKELNVEKNDWVEFKKDPTNPAEKLLCFFKCEYTRSGALKEDKTLNADKLIQHIEEWRILKATTKSEIKECVQKLTIPVNTCADVKPYHICVHNAVHKELNETH